MRTCVFCGSAERLTAEHLFGHWISSALYPSKRKIGLFHRNLHGRERKWKSTSIDYTARLLCRECNNKWFGDLEQHVKPILTPMMLRGQRTSLGMEDQIALGAWIVKTMIVYNHMWDSGNLDHIFFSAEQRKQFRDSLEPPDGVMIWLGRFLFWDNRQVLRSSDRIVGAMSGYDDTRPDLRGVQKYVLTFTLGQIAVQMLALRRVRKDAPSIDALVRFFEPASVWHGATLRIWPDPVEGAVWPPRAILTREAVQTLNDRYVTGQALWPGEVAVGRNGMPLLIDHADSLVQGPA